MKFISFALLLFVTFSGYSQARLSSVIGTEADLILTFPEEEMLTYRTDQFVQSTNQRRQFEGSVQSSRQQNTYRQTSNNPNSQTSLTINNTVRFGQVETRFKDAEAIKRLGYDQLLTRQVGNQVRAQKMENGREIQNHNWQIEANAIDGDLIAILLRGLTARRRLTSFLAQVFTKWDGGNYEMAFSSETLRSLLERERQINFPPAMRQLLQQNPNAVAWSMGLTGPASFFFPHKFYFVFEQEAPHRLLATWGGPPERANYTWLISR